METDYDSQLNETRESKSLENILIQPRCCFEEASSLPQKISLMFYHALKRNKQLKLLCEHFRQCSSDQNVGMIHALRAVYHDSYSVYKTLQRPVQLVRSLSNLCSSGGPQSEVRKCV